MATDTTRDFSPAELVRIHEANCSLGYRTDEEVNFTLAVMKHIARKLGLAELRGTSITGPGAANQKPAANPRRTAKES